MMSHCGSVNGVSKSVCQPILEYDGSFPGFLCAVAELIGSDCTQTLMDGSSGIRPLAGILVISSEKSCELFEERRSVLRDDVRARCVWNGFRRLLGPRRSRIVIESFYSDRAGVDHALASLLVRSIDSGGHVFDDLASADTSAVEIAATRTRRELELMLGMRASGHPAMSST